jgi:hypothetical protein
VVKVKCNKRKGCRGTLSVASGDTVVASKTVALRRGQRRTLRLRRYPVARVARGYALKVRAPRGLRAAIASP